jgi:hypothetical protein
MSQEIISQKMRRTCQGCELVKEFELVNMTPETSNDMQGWYTVIREVLDPQEGRFVKMMVQACSLACVPVAAVKLVLPDLEPTSDIDLKSLRAGSSDPTIN